MALANYQEIFCRMVASPEFRERILADHGSAIKGLGLTAVERRRLLSIAAQPGMRVNSAIHRANRLTPLDQTLPLTCFLLGERLRDVVDRYWSENPAENLQLPAECDRFSAFLDDELRAGRIAGPYFEEVLAFERACVELRFFTEEELRQRLRSARRLPPLVRIVRFRHDPEILLPALTSLRMPEAEVEQGDFHLLIDCRSGEAEFRLLDAGAVAALGQLD